MHSWPQSHDKQTREEAKWLLLSRQTLSIHNKPITQEPVCMETDDNKRVSLLSQHLYSQAVERWDHLYALPLVPQQNVTHRNMEAVNVPLWITTEEDIILPTGKPGDTLPGAETW